MMKFKIFKSNSNNPFVNLAIEDRLLKTITADEKFLFIYINKPSIVIGRFQNPWLECDLNKINSERIQFVRRQSGGGTVYHDLENVNFSFIQGTRDHQKDINNQILTKALKEIGVNAYASGRSDIIHEKDGPKKISGSAFKQKKDSSFHHGTMLINTQLNKLNEYLISKHDDIEAKGIKSVRSSVINLSEIKTEINTQSYIESLARSFGEFYKIENFSIQEITQSSIDIAYQEKIQAWDWMYGETPRFEISREVSGTEINLIIKKGIVEKLEIHSEYLSPYIQTLVSERLVGTKLIKSEFKKAFSLFRGEFPDHIDDFIEIEENLEKLKLLC